MYCGSCGGSGDHGGEIRCELEAVCAAGQHLGGERHPRWSHYRHPLLPGKWTNHLLLVMHLCLLGVLITSCLDKSRLLEHDKLLESTKCIDFNRVHTADVCGHIMWARPDVCRVRTVRERPQAQPARWTADPVKKTAHPGWMHPVRGKKHVVRNLQVKATVCIRSIF